MSSVHRANMGRHRHDPTEGTSPSMQVGGGYLKAIGLHNVLSIAQPLAYGRN